MKRKTHEEYVAELSVINRNILPMEKYINAATPILHKCVVDGYEWKTKPNRLLLGYGCPMCAGNVRKTHDEYVNEVSKINDNIEVLGVYKSASTHILHRCKVDGYMWMAKPNNILNGKGCPKCGGTIKKTHEQYVEEVSVINPDIEVIGTYVDVKTPIAHRCKIHNLTWDVAPDNILQGRGCCFCRGDKISDKLSKSHDEYVQDLKECNKDIVVLGIYTNSNTPILHKCLIDGNEWYAKPSNILSGKGCPQCNDSKGEREIRQWLEKNNVEYVSQKKFADCRDKMPLPFDFYLPKYNIAIEYNGEQHYVPNDFFGGEKAFISRQKHDKIKEEYCKKNNIGFLCIPYNKNVDTELNNFLFI